MGTSKPKFYEQRDGADLGTLKSRPRKNASIGELLAKAGNTELRRSSDGHQVELLTNQPFCVSSSSFSKIQSLDGIQSKKITTAT